jgi:4-cresol dehydrogenase (hydroxylating)
MFSQIEAIIGAQNILHETQARELYPCPSQSARRIKGVLRPQSIQHVQAIVRWADKQGLKLYPLSTGRNWGYGGGNPVQDDCIIVDMSALKAIREFDSELGVVTLEPGVSQGDLYDYIEDNAHPFFAPVTGSSPQCSLIGNALERGYGITPITDHFQGITEITAVLADGSLYQGQLDQMDIASSKLSKWGVGPYIEGLFSQGNFGIVVEATIRLEAKTDHSIMIIFKPKENDDDFAEAVRISKELMQTQKKVVSAIKFFNKAYSAALNSALPRDEMENPDFKILDWLDETGRKNKLPEWLGLIFIYGNDDIAHIAAKECKQRLKPHCKAVTVIDRKKIGIIRKVKKVLPSWGSLKILKAQMDTVSASYDLLRGRPQSRFLKAAYWRAGTLPKDEKAYHPGKDGCGLLWFAPMLPMKGADLLKFETLAKNVCAKFDIFPVISMTTISEQCITALLPIMFDPATELEKAMACHQALFEACKQEHYLPYRAHIDSMDWYGEASNSNKNFEKALSQAKGDIDPKNIISPGRYQHSRKA